MVELRRRALGQRTISSFRLTKVGTEREGIQDERVVRSGRTSVAEGREVEVFMPYAIEMRHWRPHWSPRKGWTEICFDHAEGRGICQSGLVFRVATVRWGGIGCVADIESFSWVLSALLIIHVRGVGTQGRRTRQVDFHRARALKGRERRRSMRPQGS